MPTSSRFAVAVHVLTLLAWAGEETLKSDYIAGSVNTNPVVIRRILCALARARLVTSQTGATGGTRLARSAAEITLREVYRAVEPRDIFALNRRPPDPECPVGMNIETVLQGLSVEIDKAVDEVFGRTTIEDVVRSVKKPCRGAKGKALKRA